MASKDTGLFPSGVGDICALAIISPRDGMSMRATLDSALALLSSARIETKAAAEVSDDGRDLATILLRSNNDRMRALKLLRDDGVKVKLWPGRILIRIEAAAGPT